MAGEEFGWAKFVGGRSFELANEKSCPNFLSRFLASVSISGCKVLVLLIQLNMNQACGDTDVFMLNLIIRMNLTACILVMTLILYPIFAPQAELVRRLVFS